MTFHCVFAPRAARTAYDTCKASSVYRPGQQSGIFKVCIHFAYDTLRRGRQWRSGLRHCATIRKVVGSIPDGFIGIFHWHNPSGRTMALGIDSAPNRNKYKEYMKREDQQDATIRCLLFTSISTCFGHHAHLQENKGPVTAFGVLFWFCWMWLVAVDGRCLAGCEHQCSHPARLQELEYRLDICRATTAAQFEVYGRA